MTNFVDIFKRTAIAISLTILLPFLVYKGFDLVYEHPHYPLHIEGQSREEYQKLHQEWRAQRDRYETYYFVTCFIIGTTLIALYNLYRCLLFLFFLSLPAII